MCMDAQQHRWVAITPETHLGILMVVTGGWCGKIVRDNALKSVLHRIHAAIRLLHGSIQMLVSQSPSVRKRHLTPILDHFGGELERGSNTILDVNNCLGWETAVNYFALSRASFSGLQALCGSLMLLPLSPDTAASSTARSDDQSSHETTDRSSSERCMHRQLPASWQGGDGPLYAVLGAVVMHGSSCLWSSLERDDTGALVAMAAGAIVPLLHPQKSAWKKLKGAALTTAGRSPQSKAARPAAIPLDRGSWIPAHHGFLQLSAAKQSSAAESEHLLHLPLVHIQGGSMDTATPGQVAQLLPLQQGGSQLLLLMLMHEDWVSTSLAQSAVAAAVGQSLQRLCGKVDAEVASEKGGHVKGFRYVFQDDLLGAVASSPSSKVATLSRESAAIATSVQKQLDAQLPHCNGDIPEDVDLEVVVRAANSDCWVSGRVVGPRRLVLVMEGRAEKGLLEASTTAAHFAASHTSGIF